MLKLSGLQGLPGISIEIDIPKTADDWFIDLGDVRESARVFVNGKEAAGLFSIPYIASMGKAHQTRGKPA